MSEQYDYAGFALDMAVRVLIVFVVGFVVITVAPLFGITVALSTPVVATVAFMGGSILGVVVGLVAALRWPEHAVAIHDQLVPERTADE